MKKKFIQRLLMLPLICLGINVMAQTTGDYRSNVAVGNWSASASWQRFDGAGPGWVAAPSAPTTADGVISILSGHNITVNTIITADQIVVDAGGTLTLTSTLNLADGAGDDLTVNGTFTWSSGILGGPGNSAIAAAGILNLTTGGNKLLNANLTNNGIINWQDGNVFHNVTSTVTNNGTININTTISNNWQSNAGTCTFINNGIINKTNTGTTTFNANPFTNAGTFNVNAGIVQTNSTVWNNTGNLTMGGGQFNNNGPFNHNTGSVINGTGNFNNTSTLNLNIDQVFPATLVFANTSTIQGAGNLTVNNDFTIQGTIQGAGSLTLNGTANTWSGGTLARALTLAAGQTLNFTTGGNKLLNANLTNNGIINWQDGNVFHNVASTVTNNGTININTTISNNWQSNAGTCTFINNGIINKTNTGTTTFNANPFTNAGTFNVNAGIVQTNSTVWNNTGNLTMGGGQFNNNGPFNHNTGSVINGTGNFNNTSTLNLNIDQVFPATLLFANTSTIQGAGNLTVNGTFTWSGGTLGGPGNSVIAATGILNLTTGSSKVLNANLTNNGAINWQDGSVFHNVASTVTNNGTINISGTTSNSWQSNAGTCTFINNGTISKSNTGTTTFTANPFTNSSTGIIKGVGIIANNSTVWNSNGVIAPGLSPGLLTITGTPQPLSANSTLQIEMQDGSGAGTGHDQLIRNSALTLAGILTVTEIGTVPNGTYTIINLTAGAVSGSFATANLPAGYTLQVNANNVQLIKNVVLPLRLISFTAALDASGNALLNWQTDNEINTSHFDVERSIDGVTYQKIGAVTSVNTAGVHNYNYTDAPLQASIIYYRLKQVDRDGRYEISPIRIVKPNGNAAILLLPNPVNNNLQLYGVKQGTPIIIYDAAGKQILSQTWSGTSVQLSQLPTGMYILHLIINKNTVVKKFLKQ
jgi:hypothetical protein